MLDGARIEEFSEGQIQLRDSTNSCWIALWRNIAQ